MRSERYESIISGQTLRESACTIIGVGAIGRQVAIQLAAMGVGTITLVDFDTVEEVNLGPQAYLLEDVGKPKVAATAQLMQRLNGDITVEQVNRRFTRSMSTHPAVFCCVDSINTRRHIWNGVKHAVDLFIDARMAAEVLRVISVCHALSHDRYPSTLFAQSEALQQGCTARSTIYCANIAAGIMVSQFTRWLRGMQLDFDIMFNLLDVELIAA